MSCFLILRVFLSWFFESSFFGLLSFVVDIRVVVRFVASWCFFDPIAFFFDEVYAGVGVARVIEEFVVFRKPTASVATSVTRCLWRNGVGRAGGDRVG